MKFISWNVNGLRAAHKKGFEDFFREVDADIFCVQETKMHVGAGLALPEEFAHLDFPGYYKYFNSAARKGYSGTAIYTKLKPINTVYGINIPEHDEEGRVITLEFEGFYFVNCYTPNSRKRAFKTGLQDDLGRCF